MRSLVTVAAVLLLVGCGRTEQPPRAAPMEPSPTTVPSTTGPQVEQREWNPRYVDDLPPARASVVAALPDVVAPPASVPALTDRPIASAVMTVRDKDRFLLLSSDGEWRSVPEDSELFGGADLSPDGTRVAVEAGDRGVDVWELATGQRRHLAPPRGFQAWDYVTWVWVDRDTLLMDDYAGGWLVDAGTGAAERVDYPSSMSYFWAIDPAGELVESADWERPDVLTDWAGGKPRRVDMRAIGRLLSPAVDTGTVVATTYETGPYAVVVAKRSDLTPLAVLPIRDLEGAYSNGGLRVVALLDDGIVLLQVSAYGRDPSWRLVAWDPPTGDLSLVSRSEPFTEASADISLADGLLG